MKMLVALLAVAFVAHVSAFDRSIIPPYALETVEKCCESNGMKVEKALEDCVVLPDENIPVCSPVIACIFLGLEITDANYVVDASKMTTMMQEQAKLMSVDVPASDVAAAIENCLQKHNPATSDDKNFDLAKFFQCVTKEVIFT